MALNYELNIFKELLEKYPTWETLCSYLESEEGGFFRIVDKDTDGMCIIRYEKGSTNMELPHSKWFRSVVWDTNNNIPVCISPSKADNVMPFTTINELHSRQIICQEFLEGFMINCFKLAGNDKLHIASRSKLNATGKFYSNRHLKQLFFEAYNNTFNVETYNDNEWDTPDASKNEAATFYSFLVQHNEHRIVKNCTENRVYLIHRGIVYNDGRISIEDTPEKFMGVSNIPKIDITIDEVSNVAEWAKNYLTNMTWEFQGLVFKDCSGNRWRIRSDKYMAVKSLRGNSPLAVDRFTQMYTQNLSARYLEYYPEEKMLFNMYTVFVNSIVKILYDNYIHLHITKTKTMNDIDKAYLPHLYNIHGIYLSKMRPNSTKMTFNDIQYYLHKQPWQRIAFLIKKLMGNTEFTSFTVS